MQKFFTKCKRYAAKAEKFQVKLPDKEKKTVSSSFKKM